MLNTAILRRARNILDINMEIWKLNKIISKNPDDEAALRILGSIYYYLKENRIAIRIYERILKIDPKDGASRLYLGYLYYEIGNLDRAIEEMNEALDLRSNDSFGYFLLGNAYSRTGLAKEAVKAYDMCIMLGFDIYKIHKEFASRFEDMNRKDKALIEYKAAHGMSLKNLAVLNKIKKLEKDIEQEKSKQTIDIKDE